MKSFLQKFGMFLVLQAVVLALLFWANQSTLERGYLAAYGDKLARLESTPPPRLILVGGSGMAFGLDSRKLESELRLPVVNMGLHAATGLEFQLETIRPHLRNGDVVFLSIEYESLDGFVRTYEILEIAATEPRALGALDVCWVRQIVDELHVFFGGLVRRGVARSLGRKQPLATIYSRKAFTDRGDMRRSLHRGSRVDLRSSPAAKGGRVLQINTPLRRPKRARLQRHMDALRDFIRHAHSEGAMVVYSYPPHPRPRLVRSAAALAVYEAALQGCEGMVMLDRPLDRALPWEMFFDTFYHLNIDGMVQHTEDVIALLKPRLAGGRGEP